MREIQDKSGLIGTHTYHLVSYKNSFVGKGLVTWLVQTKGYRCECRGADELAIVQLTVSSIAPITQVHEASCKPTLRMIC